MCIYVCVKVKVLSNDCGSEILGITGRTYAKTIRLSVSDRSTGGLLSIPLSIRTAILSLSDNELNAYIPSQFY